MTYDDQMVDLYRVTNDADDSVLCIYIMRILNELGPFGPPVSLTDIIIFLDENSIDYTKRNTQASNTSIYATLKLAVDTEAYILFMLKYGGSIYGSLT